VAAQVLATDRYVATTGNDGAHSAWSSAYTNVQDALNASGNGDTIYVAGHTFILTNQLVWAARTNVAIRGGYAATNDADQPGPYSAATWPTVLTRASAYSNRIMIVTNVYTGTLERVTITGGCLTNAGAFGGGMHIISSPGIVVSTCVISNNAVAVTGGGGGGGLYIKSSAVTVSNCLVAGNSVAGSSSSYGGGIWMEGPVTVRDSVIANNRCTGAGQVGGGVYAYQGTCVLRNCLVVGNTTFGGTGDGFRGDYGGNTLDQCTVAYNTGAGVSGRANVGITVTNSIVWGNGIDIDGTWNTKILTRSDIGYGGTGSGCISADPLFDRLYYLASGSPCLDAGTNTASERGLTNYTTRVDGTPDSGLVDLGYHYPTGFDVSGLDLYVATNGDDAAVGTDAGHPFRTLTNALARARDGTRIHVSSGSYTNGSERFPLMVANLTGVQILGTNRATTVINAAGSSNRVLTLTNSFGVALTEVTLTGGQTNTGSGGGIALWACGGVVLSGCVITNNTGAGKGGGIYSTYSSVTLSNCLVKGNTAAPTASGYGGGIYMDIGGMMTLRDSIIANNQSYSGGGIYSYNLGTCLLKNCLVVGNAAAGGGAGINCAYNVNILQSCTVAYNTGSGISGPSGAAPTVTNSIIYGNADDFSGSHILNNLVWSNIGDGDRNGTYGCISADPQFQAGNYYLADNSLCVDAGTATVSAVGLAGYTTRVDGSNDTGRVDFGYHYTTGIAVASLDVYVATNGADGNGGTSWADAYRTITKALSLAQAGTRVHIGAGSYTNGSETFPLTVANLSGVQLLGTNRATTVINAAGSGKRVLTLTNSSGLVMTELTLTGGQTNSGYGGGLALWSCSGTFSGCAITNNSGFAAGGGIYAQQSTVTFSNCLVRGNTAISSGSALGGGIYIDTGGAMTLIDSIIAHNRCTTGSSRSGGGLYNQSGTCLLKNCLVVGNTTFGGTDGMNCAYGVNTLQNCTLAYNAGVGISRPGGGGACTITNSILWGNGDDLAGGLPITPVWSDIEDGDNNGNSGCISVDPLFERGYYLAPNSACVNAGTNTASERGLAGYTTRADGTYDTGRVDLGYHYPTGYDATFGDLYVAMNGDDGALGTDVEHPFRTLTNALARARDGIRIHVAAGTYTNGSETFPLTLTALSGVQILGASRDTTVINAAGSSNRVLTLNNCSGVRLSELMLTGGYQTNSTSGGGGGIALSACGAVLAGCVVSNNTVAPVSGEADGGGIYASYSVVTLSNCLVKANTASVGASYGGGIYYDGYTSLILLNTIIANNRCTGSTRSGGGVYGNYASSSLLRNCLVVANTTTNAAGVNGTGDGLQFYGSATLENCTVANNGGQGIDRQSGGYTVTVTNSIVWGNGDDIYDSQGGGSYVKLGYSNIEDGDSNGVNGCFSLNPLFANTNAFDYRLTSKSPCINNGTNQVWIAMASDLDGNKRLQGNSVDMGAYEFLPPPGSVFSLY
jgi:hypothetical protein